MKITANDLKELNIIDKVIAEPEDYDTDNIEEVTNLLKDEIRQFIKKYDNMSPDSIADERYERFRKM